MCHFFDRVVKWEASHTAPTAYQAPQDIFLHTTIDDCNMQVAGNGADMEGSFGGNLANLDSSQRLPDLQSKPRPMTKCYQIDLFRIDEGFILLFIILLSNRDLG